MSDKDLALTRLRNRTVDALADEWEHGRISPAAYDRLLAVVRGDGAEDAQDGPGEAASGQVDPESTGETGGPQIGAFGIPTYEGFCPRCKEWKFIGHGPLCTDCYCDTQPTDGSLEVRR